MGGEDSVGEDFVGDFIFWRREVTNALGNDADFFFPVCSQKLASPNLSSQVKFLGKNEVVSKSAAYFGLILKICSVFIFLKLV